MAGTVIRLKRVVKPSRRERRAFTKLLERAGRAHSDALVAEAAALKLWRAVMSEGDRLGLIAPPEQQAGGGR